MSNKAQHKELNREHVNEQVRELMRSEIKFGFTQTQLAEKLKKPTSTVHKILMGDLKPDDEILNFYGFKTVIVSVKSASNNGR